MEQKPRWNWVITLAAVFLAFCLGFGVARWTQHTDGCYGAHGAHRPRTDGVCPPVRPGSFRPDRETDGSADGGRDAAAHGAGSGSISITPRRRS